MELTPEMLDRVVAEGENVRVELKSRDFVAPFTPGHHVALAEALASLANTSGGIVIIGVEDRSHQVEPGSFEDEAQLADQVAHVNRDLCSPPTEVRHSYVTMAGGRVLCLEVGRRGAIPHAVLKRYQDRPKERTYYVRNDRGKQLVTDGELYQMFTDPEFPVMKRSFSFVYFYQRRGLLEPLFEDLPAWSRNAAAFSTLIQRIRPVGDDEPSNIMRAVAEIFPYAVIDAVDKSLSGGWGRKITEAGLGASIEAGAEPSTVLRSEHLPSPPAGSKLADAAVAWSDLAKLIVFFDLSLPSDTKVEIRYSDPPLAASTLTFHAPGVYKLTVGYRGGAWSVGLPPDHPHSLWVHPIVADVKDPHAWLVGHVDLQFEPEFGEYGLRSAGDYYAWGRRLFEVIEWQFSWKKYLERLPNPYLLRIDRNVRRILWRLEEMPSDKAESTLGPDNLP